MFWLFIVIIAHFLNAFVFLVDKYLLKRPIPNPLVYAFYVSILSFAVLVLAPLGFTFAELSPRTVVLSLAAGGLFLPFLFFFYKAIKLKDVSTVVPFVGVNAAIFTLMFARWFLGEMLTSHAHIAFTLLLIGGTLIATPLMHKHRTHSIIKWKRNALLFSVIAGILFAASTVFAKAVFSETEFLTGFISIRVSNALIALPLLIPKRSRNLLLRAPKRTRAHASLVFLSNKALAGLSSVLLALAIALATPTLVNALQGVQYAFLFLFALIFHHRFSAIYEEKLNARDITQKIIGIGILIAGLALLR